MRKSNNIVNKILIALIVFYSSTIAFEYDSVGNIEDSLFAPTSVDVHSDNLAVLEPYSKQLKIYSADGVINFKVNIEGDAYGLTRISDYTYLFCDRERKTVVAVNAINGDQYDYFSNVSGMNNPNDILIRDSLVVVLDGESSQIFEYDFSGGLVNRIFLNDSSGQDFQYLSSFDYDSKRSRYILFDQINSSIITTTESGVLVDQYSSFGNKEGQITRGGDISVDYEGRIYVTDRFQGDLSVFNSEGRFIGKIDTFGGSSSVPTGITIDENGVLYIASTMGSKISVVYVHPSADPFASMSLTNQYPPHNATISLSDIRFETSAVYMSDESPNLTVDFQVFNDSTATDLLVEASSLPPTTVQIIDGSRHLLESNWEPDYNFNEDQSYYWRTRVKSDETTGEWTSLQLFSTASLPSEYRLDQNYPNPFNPETKIHFSIPEQKSVKLEVFNLLGQKINTIIDEILPAGEHEVIWNGKNDRGKAVSTGVYFYRLITDDYVATKKMVLIK